MSIDFQTLKIEFLKDFAIFYSPSSLRQIAYVANKVDPFLPSDIRCIDIQHIHAWVISMKEKGISPSTINTYLSKLKVLVTYGREKDYIQEIPQFSGIKVRVRKKLPSFVEDEILWRLVEASHCNSKEYALMILEYETGLLPSELSTLRRSNLNYSSRTLIVTYRDRMRTVLLSIPCFHAIRKYLESRSDVDDNLFISSRGTALSPNSCSSIIKKYARITGNESVTRSHFRGGLVPRLFIQGFPIDRIADMFGPRFLGWSLHR